MPLQARRWAWGSDLGRDRLALRAWVGRSGNRLGWLAMAVSHRRSAGPELQVVAMVSPALRAGGRFRRLA
ncbi:MAG: hypothetical protein ACK53L_11345 [Pirellulaceae bacterium]